MSKYGSKDERSEDKQCKRNWVEFLTWTIDNGQDNINWYQANMKNNIYSCDIKKLNHNHEYGSYKYIFMHMINKDNVHIFP